MINSVTLKHFQAHENSILEFSKGVNIIAGNSNTGKTSIIRALTLVKDNRPLGTGFVQDGAEVSEVILTNSVSTITRKRGETVNSYLIKQEGQKNDPCTSPGTSVPEEVTRCLNLEDINVQQQHSPYFLVFDSPGQVATYIRSMADLDEIDICVAECQKRIRSTTKEQGSLQEEEKKLSKKLVVLNKIPLERFETLLNKLELLQESCKSLVQRIAILTRLIDNYREIESTQIHLPVDIENQLVEAEKQIESFNNSLEKYNRLQGLVDSFNELKEIPLPEDINNKLSLVETKFSQYNELEQKINKLIEFTEILDECCKKIELVDAEIVTLEKTEVDILDQLTDCPSCGQKLDSVSKEYLISCKE